MSRMSSRGFNKNDLKLIDTPERDWQFQVGDFCVLNSGGPLIEVIEIVNGDSVCKWDGGAASLPSICLRPHFLERMHIALRSRR